MLLNCDLGEGMAYDAQIIPLIDMANLACGKHAGSPDLMRENIQRAKEHGVIVGAHPSYPDRENFGRVSMKLNRDELRDTIVEQIATLDSVAQEYDYKLSYVKPHGALYNDMMKHEELFESIVNIVTDYNGDMKLMMLSGSKNDQYAQIAQRYGIELIYEIFADRSYSSDGSLVPRGTPGAVIEDIEDITERLSEYIKTGKLLSIDGQPLLLKGDSICVHGDSRGALDMIKAIRGLLHGVQSC